MSVFRKNIVFIPFELQLVEFYYSNLPSTCFSIHTSCETCSLILCSIYCDHDGIFCFLFNKRKHCLTVRNKHLTIFVLFFCSIHFEERQTKFVLVFIRLIKNFNNVLMREREREKIKTK